MLSSFWFQVSRAHPLCPPKLGGRAKRRGYGINGNVKSASKQKQKHGRDAACSVRERQTKRTLHAASLHPRAGADSTESKRKTAVNGYIIPPPPYGVLAPVSGGESVIGVNHTQLCPSELGGRARRAEGVCYKVKAENSPLCRSPLSPLILSFQTPPPFGHLP